MLISFIILLSENIAACLSEGDFNSIHKAEYSLMGNIVGPLKSSVCSLLKATRRGLQGFCPWLGDAKTELCLAVQQDWGEQAEVIDLNGVSRAVRDSSVTEWVFLRTGPSLNITL